MNFCKFIFCTGSLFLLSSLNTSAQIISTVAGDGYGAGFNIGKDSGDGGQATQAKLFAPSNVTFDAAGNYYIADQENNVIRKVSSTGIITTIAGTGIQGYNGDGKLAINAGLNWPKGIVMDAAGNIYFADYGDNRIRRIDAKTDTITTLVGSLKGGGYNGDGGVLDTTEVNNPTGLAFDKQGNLYIADAGNNRIREVNIAKGTIETIAGIGYPGYSGDGSLATSAMLDYPYSIALDDTGNIYIDDMYNGCIRKIEKSTGIINTLAGIGGIYGYSGDGGPATLAAFGFNSILSIGVTGISLDATGNLYVSDAVNNCIRMVNTSGIITTIAGNSKPGYSGDGGQAITAELNQPYQVAFDLSGNMYIPDWGNNVVRKVTNVGGELSVSTVKENQNNVSVFPNPAQNRVYVDLLPGNTVVNKELLSLYTISGQLLVSQSYSNQMAIALNVTDYPDGIYILRISEEDGTTITKKVEIQK